MENTNIDIKICSFGDLMLCDSPLYTSNGVGSIFETVKTKLFSNCADLIQSSDVVIGNLEGPIYAPKNNSLKERQMSAPEEVPGLLRETGFHVVNLANNHCLQHGNQALLHTKELLNADHIDTIGLRDDEPVLMNKRGVRFAFLSLSILPERYNQESIIYNNNISDLFRQVRKYKNQVDALIVSIHWGNEFATYPYIKQVQLAHRLVDEGVCLILGHHSHTYQGIEKYKDALILYSQGNYISDMRQSLCRETGIALITLQKSHDGIKLDYEFTPYLIGEDFIPKRTEDDWFSKRQAELDRVLKGEVSEDQYWKHVNSMHARSSGEFKKYFMKHRRDYSQTIYLRMLLDAIKRKVFRTKRSNQFATDIEK